MKSIAALIVVAGIVGLSSVALAQPKVAPTPPPPAPAPAGNSALKVDCKVVVCVGEIQIVGRIQKPFVLAEVTKIPPKLTLSELREPFLDRIEEAVVRDPF